MDALALSGAYVMISAARPDGSRALVPRRPASIRGERLLACLSGLVMVLHKAACC